MPKCQNYFDTILFMTIKKKKLCKVTSKGPKRDFCNFVQFECCVNKWTKIMKNIGKNIDDKWQ